MTQEFLGVGWHFPVELDERNEIAVSRYEESVQESIEIILKTAPGERLMRPEFGCGIHEFVFAPTNTRTLGLIRFHVEESLVRWEPRIILESVTVEPALDDPAVVMISIDYTVRATDSRFNLVYPFYLERGQTE
jgi:phage baseplate assembly protein W